MPSPYPRVSFDPSDRCLLASLLATTAVFAVLFGTLACTPPRLPTVTQAGERPAERWLQLLGVPKQGDAPAWPPVPVASFQPGERALAGLWREAASSTRPESRWFRPLPWNLCLYTPPIDDHARVLFGPALVGVEIPEEAAARESLSKPWLALRGRLRVAVTFRVETLQSPGHSSDAGRSSHVTLTFQMTPSSRHPRQ